MAEIIPENNSPLNQAAKRLLGPEAYRDGVYLLQLAEKAVENWQNMKHTAMEGNEGAMELAIEYLQRQTPADVMRIMVSPLDPDEVMMQDYALDDVDLANGALLAAELVYLNLVVERSSD